MSDPALAGSCLCGKAGWALTEFPDAATSCNCTLCRRYGVLWLYGHEGEDMAVSGELSRYRRFGVTSRIELLSCPICASLVAWRGTSTDDDGRRRMALNARLADPDAVAALPLQRLDGLGDGEVLPSEDRRVRDRWF